MPNSPQSSNFGFDTEMSATSFTGSSQLLGTLVNNPVVLLIKNQTNQTVFFADNTGSTKGTTMVSGEEIVLDCRANAGIADNGTWPIGTSFYITTTDNTATGAFKLSVIMAR